MALLEAEGGVDVLPGANGKDKIIRAWETRNLLTTHLAFLKTIDAYLESGGGSRGAYLVVVDDDKRDGARGRWGDGANPESLNTQHSTLNSDETGTVESKKGMLYTFLKERMEDRTRRIKVTGLDLEVSWEDVRPLPEDDAWFETTWATWRKGDILEPEG